MKLNTNMFLSAALLATLSLMVACAPAKRGTKFDDRTGSKGGGSPVEKISGLPELKTPEAIEFRNKIVHISAELHDSIEDDEDSIAVIDKLLTDAGATLDPIKETPAVDEAEDQDGEDDDSAPGIQSDKSKSKEVSNKRAKYFMNVRVNIAGIGFLDLIGVSTKHGNAKQLKQLVHVNKDCGVKYADLKVEAVCSDKSCSKLLVQVKEGARGAPQMLRAEFPIIRKEIKPIETAEGIEVKLLTFTDLDRRAEAQASGLKIQNTMAACKAGEETTDEEAAPAVTEETPANEDSDKPKKDDGDSAAETLAGLPE